MKNKEKYREEILKQQYSPEWCMNFVVPIILKYYGLNCRTFTKCNTDLYCTQCSTIQSMWLEDEVKEDD